MIDSLCMKEKNSVYGNPNYREDCIGTQNTIFDLSSSHLIDRPGLLQKETREAKKTLKVQEGEAEFTGSSFLAGQKIQMGVKKPAPAAEIKRGRDKKQ